MRQGNKGSRGEQEMVSREGVNNLGGELGSRGVFKRCVQVSGIKVSSIISSLSHWEHCLENTVLQQSNHMFESALLR